MTPLAVQPPLLDDAVEHRLRVLVELAGGRPARGVVEDVGERALHLPGVEERLPVDVAAQLAERVVVEDPDVLGAAVDRVSVETSLSCWSSRRGCGGR